MEYVVVGMLAALLILIFSNFRPHMTSEIQENLYAVKSIIVNFYVLKLNEGIIVFDTGVMKGIAKRAFKKLRLSPDAVTHIFLTHSDGDHAGGVAAFPNAKLIMSSEEEQMINGKKARRLFIYNRKPKEVYQLLNNNDILEIGGVKVKMMLTPGHTPGSCIYIVDGKICVSGDLLRITQKGTVTQFMRMMNMDHKQNEKSLADVKDILGETDIILSGHTGILKRDKQVDSEK